MVEERCYACHHSSVQPRDFGEVWLKILPLKKCTFLLRHYEKIVSEISHCEIQDVNQKEKKCDAFAPSSLNEEVFVKHKACLARG